MTNSPAPILSSSTHDKWIAVAIWIALLVALVFTTFSGGTLAYGGSLSAAFRSLSSFTDSTGNTSLSVGSLLVATCILMATILLVHHLFKAWQKFADVTHDLIIAYVKGSEGNVFGEWLVYSFVKDMPIEEDNATTTVEVDPDESDSSSIGDTLKLIAYAWVVILVAPPLIATITVILR